MKYYLPLISILLLHEILCLPPDNQLNLFRNNLGRFDRKILNDDDISEANEISNGSISENNLSNDRKRYVDRNMEVMFSGDDSEHNKAMSHRKATPTTCPTHIPAFTPVYGEVLCQQAPGKLICNVGKYTFVINNGDHELERDALERFVSMAYTRYEEGDNTFDVAVEERETTACACYSTSAHTSCVNEDSIKEESPVIVECSRISNEKLKMCNPDYDPREKLYECKVRTIGLRKRRKVLISVNGNGEVFYAESAKSSIIKARRKRELLWPDSVETMGDKHDILKRISGVVGLSDEEDFTEENDQSNLYYHTKVPYVRNYTDRCTLQYQFYPWCPTYLTDSPCQITISSSYNATKRPCRYVVPRSPDSNNGDTTVETTQCTIEVTTNDALLRNTKKPDIRRKRHRVFWRKRRRLPKPVNLTNSNFGVEPSIDAYRSSNDLVNDRPFNADANLLKNRDMNSGFESSVDISSCPPCAGISSTQWCSVPCNDSPACLISPEQSSSVANSNQQLNKFFGNFSNQNYEESLRIQNQESVNNDIYSATASLTREREFLSPNDLQLPVLERPSQHPSFNSYHSLRSIPLSQIKNDLRHDYQNYDRQDLQSSDDTFPRHIYHHYRPRFRHKRRLMYKKIPGSRKRHIKSWLKKRTHYCDVNDIAR